MTAIDTSPYLSGNYGPVTDEVTAFDLPVVGELSWAQILGAALVILAGKIMAARAQRAHAVDLAADEQQTKSS